jgi:hypothetical protein
MWNPLRADFAVQQVVCHNGVYGTVTYSRQKTNFFFHSDPSVCPDMAVHRSKNIGSDDTMSLSWASILLQ